MESNVAQALHQFELNVNLISSLAIDPASRHAADQWLTHFKSSEGAWPVIRQVLCSLQEGGVLVYYAASMLAWKAKKQPRQLEAAGPEAELLQLTSGLLMREITRGDVPVARALCSALANIVIHGTQVANPLDGLYAVLDQAALLEFFTILPGECEDACVAAQSFSMEHAFQLKMRIREWSMEVGAWLHNLHSTHLAEFCRNQGLEPPTNPAAVQAAVSAAAAGNPAGNIVTLSKRVLACFTAWVKWGCLQYLELDHTYYLLALGGSLLFVQDLGLTAIAVDALSEVAEHATDALLPELLNLARRVAHHVNTLVSHRLDPGNLPHVYAALCTANIPACIAWDAQGAALRQGLLLMVQLPAVDREGELCEVATPAINALTDIVEQALLDLNTSNSGMRGEGAYNGYEAPVHGSSGSTMNASGSPLLTFVATVVDALLLRLQPADEDLVTELEDECEIEELRSSADALIEVCAEALGAEGLVERMGAFLQRARQMDEGIAGGGGGWSGEGQVGIETAKALDVCLYALRAASSPLTEHNQRPGAPLPQWFSCVLALYRLILPAKNITGASGAGATVPAQCTLLHWDFLTSFTSLAPALVPLLKDCPQQAQQELMSLLLTQAVGAMSSSANGADHGGDGRVVGAAADAVRALFSFAPSSDLQVNADLVNALGHMLSLLSQRTTPDHQSAARQLVVALVHAVHAVDPADQHTAAAAQSLVDTFVTGPLTAAVARATTAAAASSAAAATTTPNNSLTTALLYLQLALQQVQALLNAFESYLDEYTAQATAAALHTVAHAVAATAVASFMTVWTRLIDVCRSRHAEALFPELNSCLESCIALQPAMAAASLQSVLECIAAVFDLPGGCALHRAMCSALEAFGAQPAHQPLLLTAAASVLTAPGSVRFLTVRGGDQDPDTALALLTVTICVLRQAVRWSTIPNPRPLAVICDTSLRLAAANAACNHRDLSQRSIAALSAFILLALEGSSPAHSGLLDLACQQGPVVVQALLLSLVALHSSANLPKVVSLMSDVARLVTTCSSHQDARSDPATLFDAAQVALQGWAGQARSALVSAAVLPAELVDGVLMQWDWVPVLQQAALQVAQKRGWAGADSTNSGGGNAHVDSHGLNEGNTNNTNNNYGSVMSNGGMNGVVDVSFEGLNEAEVRRRVQRSVRQLADAVRKVQITNS